MRERRKGQRSQGLCIMRTFAGASPQLVAVAKEETVPRSAPESVQSRMLTALIDVNKLLRGLTLQPGIDVQVSCLSCNAKAGPTRSGWAHMQGVPSE
jgi:hypothetical protein